MRFRNRMCTYAYFAKTGDRKSKSQYEMASALYEPRAVDYDDSWHPDYTRRLMDLLDVRPDDRILSLGCGTGLEVFYTAPELERNGTIIGIDASKAMLEVARRKLDADPTLKQHVQLLQHDMSDLETCSALEKHTFDVIICSNAFVLLDKREEIIAKWAEYLKPNGRMVIDIPSEQSIPEGTIMENACKQLGAQYASDRSCICSIDSFSAVLKSQGLDVKIATTIEKRHGKDIKYLDKPQLENQFGKVMQAAAASNIVGADFFEKAKPLFIEEWNRLAVDGRAKVCEGLYLYIAEKMA